MKVLDEGHDYELENYDGEGVQRLTFMKREGPGYPFNIGHHPGTNCQEVLRVFISRVKYLDRQIPCDDNKRIIAGARRLFLEFERRGAMRHGDEELEPLQLWNVDEVPVEDFPHCRTCGHIRCFGHEKKDGAVGQREVVSDHKVSIPELRKGTAGGP